MQSLHAIPTLSGKMFGSQRFAITCRCLVPSILSFAFCSAKDAWLLSHKYQIIILRVGILFFTFDRLPFGKFCELLYLVSLILCTCFAMSHVPFVRLCRGFVGRQLVKPIVARNMASARKNKVLVTRSVPQAAIEIIKSSHR